ncbi:hypothetical protein OIV83_001235 [Microbotryomycetes sp. JL201]|nr:hypothetical protein OIV83_001235 [Microbotryomycetes sp. JL201]
MPPAPTPLSRLVKLVTEAAALIDVGHPAHAAIQEAAVLGQGFDNYVEAHSGELYVPDTFSEEQVRQVWTDLLKATDEQNWRALWEQGKTQFALTSGMCSGNYEATVLQQIGLMLRPKNVLEIGVFTGTATLAVALLPSVEKVIGLDIEPFLEEFDRPYWRRAGVSDKIQTMIGPATDSLMTLKTNKHAKFDLIFIDADKPSYQTYVSSILEHDLLAIDGVILADNTLLKGFPWAAENASLLPSEARRYEGTFNKSVEIACQGIDDFNKFCIQKDLFSTMLPIRDGVTVIRRR